MPKISELNALTYVTNEDLMVVVNDPSGLPATKKITVGNFFSNVAASVQFTNNVTFSKSISVSNTTISNATLSYSINNSAVGGVNANSTTYQTTATKLNVNNSIQYLAPNTSGNGSDKHFYLPPGANGQIMYFAGKTSQHIGDIYIWVDKLRTYNLSSTYSNTSWYPFTSRTLAMACYIDGAWNIDNNSWD
jgi:hypothetical protein